MLQQLRSLFYTKGLGSGADRRSVPQKQAHTFPETLNALSLSIWPFFQRVCRGATTDTARERGPSSTSNRAKSFIISLGDTGRCYGVSLCRADASDQRRARCWLPFFGVTGRDSSCHRTEHVGAASSEAFALYVIVAGFGRAPKTFPNRAHQRSCSRLVRIMLASVPSE